MKKEIVNKKWIYNELLITDEYKWTINERMINERINNE